MNRGEKRLSIPAWVWIAAVALVLVAAFTAWQAQRFAGQLAVLRLRANEEQQRGSALQSEQTRYQQALDIVAASATRAIELKPVAASKAGAPPSLSAYWNSQLGLVISADRVPQPAIDRVLQLWIVPRSGAPANGGIFRPNAAGQVLLVVAPGAVLADAKRFTVTDEPAGGSSRPTAPPKWSAPVAAK